MFKICYALQMFSGDLVANLAKSKLAKSMINKGVTMATRKEHDFIGELEIDDSVYYGVQTFRAVENFNISHDRLGNFPRFVRNLARVKKAAALANYELGLLDENIKNAIT